MFELVENKVKAFGYSIQGFDETIISYIIDKAEKGFLIDANCSEIPDEMRPFLADQVCGEFLMIKRAAGAIDIETIDFDAVKSMTMGDTAVSYGTTAAERFDGVTDALCNSGKDKYICYRKIRW